MPNQHGTVTGFQVKKGLNIQTIPPHIQLDSEGGKAFNGNRMFPYHIGNDGFIPIPVINT